ncbi:hypothetical protein [Nostoc sp. FACHB-888]|uniref:hypothetical protein n=1 Tax=Nostoc sp. FACHB-888 TaxID=2692842 RepID=UPI001F554B99|nr:hypothetical protein [Nostoc sp. FACHB-888]
MDNCSIHKGKEIEKLIEAVGAKLIYLPPYFLIFHQLKIVGQRSRTFYVLLVLGVIQI